MTNREMIVVMGVSASGKTTIAAALAQRLQLPFLEGDELHSTHNIDKMRSGQALNDQDRAPWLDAIARVLQDSVRYPNGLVVACSALKRAYRDRLRRSGPIRFVFLDLPQLEAERRLRERPHHFMPLSLLASQFATLERPTAAEHDTVTVAADAPVGAVLQAALSALRR